jgi:DNA transformation protein
MLDDEIISQLNTALKDREIQSRKMFGGIGIFSEKIMFALIYNNTLYFRSTGEIANSYSLKTSQFQHPSRKSKMPYWKVPKEVINNKSKLSSWGKKAFQIAKSLKQNK